MKRFFVILWLAFANFFIWTSVAWAGPAAGALMAGIFKKFIISMIINAVTSKFFGPKKRGQGQQARGLMVNKNSNSDPIPVIYGRKRMGGTRVYVESSNGSGDTSGTNQLNMVLALCEGEMGAIRKVVFNDEVTWEGSTADGALSSLTGKYASKTTMVYHSGSDSQSVDTMIQTSVDASNWGSNHKLGGVAYLAIKLEADAEVWEGGLPLVTVELDGKKIADVSDVGSGDSVTSGADQNPVDAIYDYLTNSRYGKGIPASEIDLSSFQSARTYCASRYAINGDLDTSQQMYDNINELLDSCNGLLVYTAGTYRLRIRQASEPSVFTYNKDNIIGQIEIGLPDVTTKLNKVTTTFQNKDLDTGNGYSAYNDDVKIIPVDGDTAREAFLTDDNSRVLEARIENRMVTDPALIQTLAEYKLDASRKQFGVSFEAAHNAIQVEAGDIVTLQHDDITLFNSGKLFRVLSLTVTANNTIDVVLQEYDSSIEI